MNKKLIFAHNWIGPRGPLNNSRIPHFYDLAKCLDLMTLESGFDFGPGTLYGDLKQHTEDCIVVPTSEIDSLGDKPFLYEIQLNASNILRDFSPHAGVLEKNILDTKLLDKIKTGNGYLLLTTLFESFLEDDIFLAMHRYFNQSSIPLKKIIYFNNCINGDSIYKNFCLRYNLTPEINCEYVGLYLLQQVENVTNNLNKFVTKKEDIVKKHIFLNFNRRSRNHRLVVLLKLYSYKLMDNISISFNKPHDINTFINDCSRLIKEYNIENVTVEDIKSIYNSLPFYLDKTDLDRFPVEDKIADPKFLYDNTYISLVSETNFENNIIHMTEKTIKPIMFKQPFIIIGPSHTLKYLKSMGFKTFSNFWDESYDDDSDHISRMNKIFNIINEISNWPEEKLKDLEINTREILNYNFFNMIKLRKSPKYLQNFIKKYGAEL